MGRRPKASTEQSKSSLGRQKSSGRCGWVKCVAADAWSIQVLMPSSRRISVSSALVHLQVEIHAEVRTEGMIDLL